MKKNGLLLALLGLFATALSSCQAIKDLVGFGFWMGVIAVVLIVAIILWLVGKAKN